MRFAKIAALALLALALFGFLFFFELTSGFLLVNFSLAIYWLLLFWTILWCWGMLVWADWYLDVWIITNQRVIDIEQQKFFNRRVTQCGLDRVQNVTSKVLGALPTFFKYGDIEISMDDRKNNFIFKQVSCPARTQDIILRARQELIANEQSKN